MAANVNSNDKEGDSKSALGSDGTIRPFMFEPQDGTSSEEEVDSDTAQDQPETVESEVRSRLGNRDWCICTNYQVMPTETESVCCQEMDVQGHHLDLGDRNETL